MQAWRASLQGSYPSTAHMLSACTWGALSIASLTVLPYIDIGCATYSGDCFDTYNAIVAAVDDVVRGKLYDYVMYDHVSVPAASLLAVS